MLSTRAVVQGSQNQNAGFVAWFCLAILLQNSLQFKRVCAQTDSRYVRLHTMSQLAPWSQRRTDKVVVIALDPDCEGISAPHMHFD